MSDQSTLSALVRAWADYERDGFRGHADRLAMDAAIGDFCSEHQLDPLFVRSEMLRLRQKRPVPDRAAVLVAIIEGTDQ